MDMVLIRKAAIKDVPELIAMGKLFYNELDEDSKNVLKYNEDSFIRTLDYLIGGKGVILVAERDGQLIGTIAGDYSPWILDYNTVFFKEYWWWVDEEYRGSAVGRWLIESAQNQAKIDGATHFAMGTRAGENEERLANIYKRKGYKQLERHFIKEL